jgi:hypothetical protein
MNGMIALPRLRGFAVAMTLAVSTAATAQDVKMATFVGGEKADMLTAAAVLPDGSVVVGGVVDAPPEGRKGDLLEGGQGMIVLLDKAGKAAAEQRLPGGVSDLCADAEGNIYATGGFGSAKYDAGLKKPTWTSDVGGAEARIAAGPAGSAVLLVGKKIVMLDARGNPAGGFDLKGDYLTDVACDPATKRIFVCGFDNKRGTPPGQKNYPVQVAFVRAFDLDGRQVWSVYGWGGQQVADLHLMADTRAYRLAAVGGKLYVAGESAGGNTMFSCDSLDLAQQANLVKGDAFQHAYNTVANHITAVVRLDAATGKSEAATLLLARLSSGRGNTIRPRALAADAKGNVYVGGASAFSPPKSPGSYGREGGGAYFVAFDPEFRRTYATTLAGGGTTRAIAVGPGSLVAVGDCKTEFEPVRPLKSEGDPEGDGFLVWFETGK